jgi:ribosomal protein L40E
MSTEPNVPASVSDVNAASSPAKFRWLQVVELGYVEDNEAGAAADDEKGEAQICFHCGAAADPDTKLSKCSKCQVASYW